VSPAPNDKFMGQMAWIVLVGCKVPLVMIWAVTGSAVIAVDVWICLTITCIVTGQVFGDPAGTLRAIKALPRLIAKTGIAVAAVAALDWLLPVVL
jgi:hypothetical protein